MKRREFIGLVGGATIAWPFAARAQQGQPMRRIGILTGFGADDAEGQARIVAFTQTLALLGWTDGRSAQKVLWDPAITAGIGQFAIIQSVAQSVGLEVSPVNVRDAGEIERAIAAFARSSNGGLIVTGSALALVHREMIIALAARHELPAVYNQRLFTADGGLISCGAVLIDQFRGAAGYVDRILKGEKPGDLPMQAPTKYELVVNLKTAKALGLTVPPTLLARADEVIE
jgi:ABC-type uncharacterized transport system substrate-binding protein